MEKENLITEREWSDYKGFNLEVKKSRQKRFKKFGKYKDKLISAGYTVTFFEQQSKFSIEPSGFGVIDYYPKANRLLFRKENRWISDGLNWIYANLL